MDCHIAVRVDTSQYRECRIADRQEPVEVTSSAEGSTGRVIKSLGPATNLKYGVNTHKVSITRKN
jgi:hypothetical protein